LRLLAAHLPEKKVVKKKIFGGVTVLTKKDNKHRQKIERINPKEYHG